MNRWITSTASRAMSLSLLFAFCLLIAASTTEAIFTSQEQVSNVFVYTGKVLGKSRKAGLISLEVDSSYKPQLIHIRFDDTATGIDHLVKGNRAVIHYEKRANKIFATAIQPALTQLPAGAIEISVDEVYELTEDGMDFTLIDSRPFPLFAASHLPGAVSIPASEMKNRINLLPQEKNKLLIFYCGGPTWLMSSKAARLAVQAGYTNVRVMLAGEPGWIEEDYATFANQYYITLGNIVLVDLRSTEKAEASRIPGSVSIPLAAIEGTIDEIPTYAPVVLYSDNQDEAMEGLEFFRDEGYAQVSLIEGGFQRWKQFNGEVTSGPALEDVLWKRPLTEGEVSFADFTSALKGNSKAVIVDVRSNKEVKRGKLKQSFHIPLDELIERMDTFFTNTVKLAKDQEIYIHCASGDRAEMAYRALKDNGYNAHFLVAMVLCKGEDCSIIPD